MLMVNRALEGLWRLWELGLALVVLAGRYVAAAVTKAVHVLWVARVRSGRALTRTARWARAQLNRRNTSVVTMVAGVSAAGHGAYLQWGSGVALLVLAGLLIPLSLLIGWES